VTSDPSRSGEGIGHRERRKRETRAALIEAALRLAAEYGADLVTVDQISTAANVSPRTFFNYFSSKEEALTQIGLDAGDRITRRIREAPPDLGSLAAVRAALAAEAASVEQEPSVLCRQLAVVERSPELWSRLVASGEVMMNDLVDAVAHRTGLDPIEHPYPGVVASVALAVFRSALIRWHHINYRLPLTELLNEAFDLLAEGLPDPDRPT